MEGFETPAQSSGAQVSPVAQAAPIEISQGELVSPQQAFGPAEINLDSGPKVSEAIMSVGETAHDKLSALAEGAFDTESEPIVSSAENSDRKDSEEEVEDFQMASPENQSPRSMEEQMFDLNQKVESIYQKVNEMGKNNIDPLTLESLKALQMALAMILNENKEDKNKKQALTAKIIELMLAMIGSIIGETINATKEQ